MQTALAMLGRALDPRRLFARAEGGLSIEEAFRSIAQVRGGAMPRVTAKGALSIAAAWACQNAVATDLASLPLVVMRRKGKKRELGTDHPAYEILGLSPDGVRSSIDFRQAQQGHALGWGNGISEVLRDRASGELEGLRLEPPGGAQSYRRPSDGGVGYRLSTGRRVRAEDVLHVAGFGPDGLNGYTPLELHRQTIELGLVNAAAGLNFYKNGALPGGFFRPATKLSPEAIAQFLGQFSGQHAGPTNAGRLAMLPPGMEFTPSLINPRDAQYLELRQFTVLEICRIYRCPPHKICDFSQIQLASSAVEAANIEYVATTLVPWARKWEQQIALKLFTAAERAAGYYARHNFMALLRGDVKTRAEYYRLAVSNGWMTRDEVRELEDLDPFGPDLGGDKVTVQGQMIDLSAVSDKPASSINPNPKPAGDDPDGEEKP